MAAEVQPTPAYPWPIVPSRKPRPVASLLDDIRASMADAPARNALAKKNAPKPIVVPPPAPVAALQLKPGTPPAAKTFNG